MSHKFIDIIHAYWQMMSRLIWAHNSEGWSRELTVLCWFEKTQKPSWCVCSHSNLSWLRGLFWHWSSFMLENVLCFLCYLVPVGIELFYSSYIWHNLFCHLYFYLMYLKGRVIGWERERENLSYLFFTPHKGQGWVMSKSQNPGS